MRLAILLLLPTFLTACYSGERFFPDPRTYTATNVEVVGQPTVRVIADGGVEFTNFILCLILLTIVLFGVLILRRLRGIQSEVKNQNTNDKE